ATISDKINVGCAGGNTGSFKVTGGGGSGPFDYKLGSTGYVSNGTFSNLGPGSYVVTIRNSLGCTKDTTIVITQAPNTIVADTGSVTHVPCSGGKVGAVTIVATGIAPLQYRLDSLPYQNNNTFNGLAAGNYVVTVKDGGGCTKEVLVKINQTDNTVTASISSRTDVPCSAGNVGALTVTAAGGTAPYEYKIGNNAYVKTNTFTGLAAGPYLITVKDARGCLKEVKDTIKQLDNTVNAVTRSKKDISCTGEPGSVAIDASGGTAPYQYKLNNGAYVSSDTFTITTGGDYIVTVKDTVGCTFELKFTIASPGGTPGTITPATSDPICDGTTRLLTASDGASYQWYRNDTLITGASGKTYAAGQAGKYTVKIGNGTCVVPASTTVTVTVNACTETVVFVAKAFTPNGNNVNEKLLPRFINVKQFRYFKVYNRWGQLVYETSVIGEGWDGMFKG
ncbi:MAG: hypothetical protein EOP49_38835, partial [Sphingobacteriales bacterium]